jgi:hypothetical protein
MLGVLTSVMCSLSILCLNGEYLNAQTATDRAPNATAYSKLRTPTSLSELLDNIRTALDYGLLLDRSSYGEEQLKRLFGGNSVKWDSGRRSDDLSGEILGLDGFVEPVVVNGIRIRGLSIDFSWQDLGNGHRNARLFVFFLGHIPVYFDDVVGLFGPNWTKAPTEAPIPDRIYDTVTAPHGNEVILYEFSSKAGQAKVRVEFRGDASLRIVNIASQEGK